MKKKLQEFFKRNRLFVFLSLGFFVFGTFFFLFKRDWLIVHWVPGYKRSDNVSYLLKKRIAPKKNIKFYFWKNEDLKNEESSFVLLSNKADNLKLVISTWLSFVYEERVLNKKVGIDSVALSVCEQIAYLSFDQGLLDREWSIRKKWHLLDGLCKTIVGSGQQISNLVFLVNHQSMIDDHLDFSQPWPVQRA